MPATGAPWATARPGSPAPPRTANPSRALTTRLMAGSRSGDLLDCTGGGVPQLQKQFGCDREVRHTKPHQVPAGDLRRIPRPDSICGFEVGNRRSTWNADRDGTE